MNTTTIVNNFCEKRLIGNPEYFSSFSALLISLIPYIGIKYSKNISYGAFNIYILLIITGITSFGYHWTGWYIFKHLDEIPMLLSVWLGMLSLSKEYPRNFNFNFTINLYFTLILAINTVPSLQFLFPYLFSISLLSTVPLLLLKLRFKKYTFKKNSIIKLSLTGILLCILSGAIWITSEIFCNKWLILAHSLWHLGIGMGVYYIILSEEYFKNKKDKQDVNLKYIYKVIPVIN